MHPQEQKAPRQPDRRPPPGYMGPKQKGRRAVVLLSGGQDSLVAALLAKEWCEDVHAVHFVYGQRHGVETDAARHLAHELGLPLIEMRLELLAEVGDSALVDGAADMNGQHPRAAHLPASFVPGRNVLFFGAAAALAFKLEAGELWTGICQSDFTNYPDCREDFLISMQDALRHSLDQANLVTALRIVAPLLKLSKAETYMLAAERGRLDMFSHKTHTCYYGTTIGLSACSTSEVTFESACRACRQRSKGRDEFTAQDPRASVGTLAARLRAEGYSSDECADAIMQRCRYFEARQRGEAI